MKGEKQIFFLTFFAVLELSFVSASISREHHPVTVLAIHQVLAFIPAASGVLAATLTAALT
jgi:hypothetical protein